MVVDGSGQCDSISNVRNIPIMLNRCTGDSWRFMGGTPARWRYLVRFDSLWAMSEEEWDEYVDRVGVLSESELRERYGAELTPDFKINGDDPVSGGMQR